MSLYKQWQELVESQSNKEKSETFWKEYFEAEKGNYEKILSDHETVLEGSLIMLAEGFEMDAVTFTGFLDGINTSLVDPLEMESITEEMQLKLAIDYDSLYFNMLDAKANWLYELPQWDLILSDERRRQITKEYRTSKIAVSNKVGRNEPCTCGSGKKYKKCCGAAS